MSEQSDQELEDRIEALIGMSDPITKREAVAALRDALNKKDQEEV